MLSSIVWTLYTKSGAKNSYHGSVDSASTIGAVSNIGIQIFRPAIGNTFREAKTVFDTRQWDFVRQISFLTLLGRLPQVNNGTLALNLKDVALFKELRKAKGPIAEAMKLFRKRKQGPGDAVDER